MPVTIAIPEPTLSETDYNERSLTQYLAALEAAGARGIVVRLNEAKDRVARILAGVDGILLPGSSFDVDPERYGEARIPECGPADAARTAVDELMLQDAFNLKKPILGICHGTQTLNVWRNGSLIQDIETELKQSEKTAVNHRPGRDVVEAHPVKIAKGSRLSRLVPEGEPLEIQVNSSHHQAVRVPGDKLLVSAVSADDGVIEAVELDSAEHFVVAVQWHPERTYAQSAVSRALFASFVKAASEWKTPQIEQSVSGYE
jgi:putative glutamine amidotransferase